MIDVLRTGIGMRTILVSIFRSLFHPEDKIWEVILISSKGKHALLERKEKLVIKGKKKKKATEKHPAPD